MALLWLQRNQKEKKNGRPSKRKPNYSSKNNSNLLIISLMRHPNVIQVRKEFEQILIIQYLGIYVDSEGQKYIITDYMNRGGLIDVLRASEIALKHKYSM